MPAEAATRAQTRVDAHFDFVVLVASIGGMDALRTILPSLHAGLPAALAVVFHRSDKFPSLLTEILRDWTSLDVQDACVGAPVRAGTLTVAPPDLHLTVRPGGTYDLTDGQRISRVRSSGDPLLASAAEVYGTRALGVVLTGSGRDGTAGAISVKQHGGTVIAQDEATSKAKSMPHSAAEEAHADFVLPLGEIGPAIASLVTTGSYERRAP